MEEGQADIRILLPQGGLDMNMDDVAFRMRVREMLRARQAGASFCDDDWHQVRSSTWHDFCSQRKR